MALDVALNWLRGPLMDISGLVDMVSSFFFQFRGIPVRELPRESTSTINCLVALTNAWAVGDSAGHVSVFDLQCKRLLRTYRHGHPVYTVASFGENGFMCNAGHGFWVWNNHKSRRVPGEDENCIFKLVSFPDGLAASCSKLNGEVHVYDLHGASTFLHILLGPGRVSDIVECGDRLASVHETEDAAFNIAVQLWDARRGTIVHTVQLQCPFIYNVISIEHSLVFIDPQLRVHVHDLETGHQDVVAMTYRLCAIPDGRVLITSVVDDTFQTVELPSPSARPAAPPDNTKDTSEPRGICWMLYSPAGFIVSCKYNKISVWK